MNFNIGYMEQGTSEQDYRTSLYEAIAGDPPPRVVEQCEYCNHAIFEGEEMVDIGLYSYHHECCLKKMEERPGEILDELGIDIQIA